LSLSKLGLEEVIGDPNHTCQSHPHRDVIKEALKAAGDQNASEEERANANRMLEAQFT
jgi:hypothetical protein